MGKIADGILFYGLTIKDQMSDDLFAQISGAIEDLFLPVRPKEISQLEVWKNDFLRGEVSGNIPQFDNCGSDSSHHVFLYMKRYTSTGSSHTDINDKMLKVNPDWDTKLKRLCDALEIEFKQPGWKLASWYG